MSEGGGRNRIERSTKPRPDSREEAEQQAKAYAGEKPTRENFTSHVEFADAINEYWDRYYERYYSLMEDDIDRCLGDDDDDISDDEHPHSHFHEHESHFTMPDDELRDMRSNAETLLELQRLRMLLDLLGGTQPRSERFRSGSMFFREPADRREVFEFSKAIAEYLRTANIKDLVIVDRSSRPLYIGVKEYWHNKFPGDKIPGIYFVNPKGFMNTDTSTTRELRNVTRDASHKEDLHESEYAARTEQEVMDEFRATYTELMKHRDLPILIFDTCIHTGQSLYSVVDIFGKLGFSDVRVGAVNPSDPGAKVETDFSITTRRPEGGCYPFDRDRMIEKTFEHVYSKPGRDRQKTAMGAELRAEISKIMRENLENS